MTETVTSPAALQDPITTAHVALDKTLADLRDSIVEPLLDHAADGRPVTAETVLAQLLMEFLADATDADLELDGAGKVRLAQMAVHMGPDWAQVLYRAAVFITKVA